MLTLPASEDLTLSLNHHLWTCLEKPQTNASLRLDEAGLHVSFCVHERQPLITATVQQEPMLMVCQDSAVELFLAFADSKEQATTDFKPQLEHCLYINIEINAAGICYAKHGHSRKGRTAFTPDEIKSLNIEPVIDDAAGTWQVSFVVPRELITKLATYDAFSEVFALNLYKISETKEHEHYIAYNKVEVEKPNFHLPEFFALACPQAKA